jgi:hypothetical protein
VSSSFPLSHHSETAAIEGIFIMKAPEDKTASNKIRNGVKKLYYMLGFFSLGLLGSVGHHLFHAHLNGKPVPSHPVQQWYGRVSLGFSLLVRYCFKVSISIAFAQAFWHGLKTQATDLSTVDAVSKLLSNPKSFFKKSVWKFSKVLAAFTFFSW